MHTSNQSPEQIRALQASVLQRYRALQAQKLNLDLTRGKPCSEQLDLSNCLDGILEGDFTSAGPDPRNYGDVWGIPEARELGAKLLGRTADEVMAGGNASLTLMYFAVLFHMLRGSNGPDSAWNKKVSPKMICPVPGYDRHFSICETLGVEMVTVPMTDTGPDMDAVEAMVKADSDVIGIWCMPKYSNPTGCIYSDETIDRLAALGKIADPNFKVFLDEAYLVHDLVEDAKQLASVVVAAKKHGTEDSIWQFTSTSKITFSGSGISWVASSNKNLQEFAKYLVIAVIGFDRVNQLRHARMFPDMASVMAHMAKHRNIMKPKFDAVLEILDKELSSDFGSWTKPEGGYFVSFDTTPGLASKIVELAAGAGVKLTPAGATFPYKRDPNNSNIRLAPSAPSLAQVTGATEVFAVCVQLATLNSLIG